MKITVKEDVTTLVQAARLGLVLVYDSDLDCCHWDTPRETRMGAAEVATVNDFATAPAATHVALVTGQPFDFNNAEHIAFLWGTTKLEIEVENYEIFPS